MTRIRSVRSALLIATAGLIGFSAATPAQAWWRGGLFIGLPPVVIGPPVVYAPPAYYPPPPAYYPPPAAYSYPAPAAPAEKDSSQQQPSSLPYGSTCYAGFYVCPAPAYSRVTSGCSCPGIGAPSYGTVR